MGPLSRSADPVLSDAQRARLDLRASYLRCDHGWFLAVRYDDRPVSKQGAKDPQTTWTDESETATGFGLRSEWIDARPKASAGNE